MTPDRQLRRLSLLVACAAAAITGCASEPWTIECLTLSGSTHRQTAVAVADVLRNTPGVLPANVYILHDQQDSSIYHGTYQRRINRRTGQRPVPEELRADLAMLKELADDQGRHLFIGATMVIEPLPDVGRPEWNLLNVEGEYTLQVAAFFRDHDLHNFKQAAAEYCASLRNKGYPAYYHHGESISVVTIGVFGHEALDEQSSTVRFVQVPADGGMETKRIVLKGYSHAVKKLRQKEAFAFNLNNGRIWNSIQNGKKLPVQSALVKIPKREVGSP